MILLGTEAKELYYSIISRESNSTQTAGVFEYFDKGLVKYKAFTKISNELFQNNFESLETALRWINGG